MLAGREAWSTVRGQEPLLAGREAWSNVRGQEPLLAGREAWSNVRGQEPLLAGREAWSTVRGQEPLLAGREAWSNVRARGQAAVTGSAHNLPTQQRATCSLKPGHVCIYSGCSEQTGLLERHTGLFLVNSL